MEVYECSYVVQKIFDYIDDDDKVHECRSVCRTWYHEAIRWLKKRPYFAVYHYYTKYGRIFLKDGPICNVEKFSVSDLIKYLPDYLQSDTIPPCNPPCREWDGEEIHYPLFYGPGISRLPKTAMDIAKAIQFAVEGGVKSRPDFSFISYVDDTVPKIFPKIRNPSSLVSFGMFPELGTELHALKFQFFAFHFKQFVKDCKVIVTDWSDPRNIKLDLNDQEYPIKTLIYFCLGEKGHSCQKVKKFIENSCLHYSGACYTECDEEKFVHQPWSRIPFLHSVTKRNECVNKSVSCLSIAFAGKCVQSASVRLCNELTNSTEKLVEFRRNLTFPINDGRVFAFLLFDKFQIFDGYAFQKPSHESYSIHLSSTIKNIFPELTIIDISDDFCDIRLNSESGKESILHLIRL